MRTSSYCVVGGGISGLTAAYRLRVAVGDEASITVFDPADRHGGVLRPGAVGGGPQVGGAAGFGGSRP
ncbi:NAD(P)-binding protein, partial [Candidatus Mycobacterium methanotrophicum]|uniref:NAD(P)-binding protein n=1 Tax=Candidatus Mycobacterium methanotrophicum TaxID=2943498 RepID=UPI001C5860D4